MERLGRVAAALRPAASTTDESKVVDGLADVIASGTPALSRALLRQLRLRCHLLLLLLRLLVLALVLLLLSPSSSELRCSCLSR